MASEVARVARRIEEAKETKHLDLSNCELMKIPDAAYFMLKNVGITTCDLSKNSLKRLPVKFLESFPSLTCLNIQANKVATLPEEIKNMSELRSIDISSNNIEEFPAHLCHCPSLEKLNLKENKIKEVDISAVLNRHTLKELNLQDNPLGAEFQTSLANVNNLEIHIGESDPLGKELDELE